MVLRQAWGLAKEAVSSWIDDDAPSMGAALAYYTVFSVAPLLLIVIAVAGLVFGRDAARGEIIGQLSDLLGADMARVLEKLLDRVNQTGSGVLATAVGVVVMLVGATTVFAELQSALDCIWRVPARASGTGLWRVLRTRLLSLGMVLGLGFLLMVSLVVSLLVLLVWVYWSAQIFLLGAEFTWVWANRLGSLKGSQPGKPLPLPLPRTAAARPPPASP